MGTHWKGIRPMNIRQVAAFVFFAAVSTGCGGVSDPEYRIEHGENGSMVIHSDSGSMPVTSGTVVKTDGTEAKLSSTDTTQSIVYVDCCEYCVFWSDGTFYCAGCDVC
ncbi:hypothetical protein VZQ01_34435 [Myxococcus faecalis]|uniref:hypothetical protein n=2 Tax=Myxococcus TaxID=32 RepID=UPI001CBB7EF4|nr:hypothetical protein [Myxococcus sp. XM-1-1-1]MBZ4407285.1 hypothetical protein [Myxococcus sp. XM-1-1-1]BDT35945.1 hypothetical protein MFMH1_56140 [Myxococcus sp. MH1]